MITQTFEERLEDEFCVMLERASREGQDATYWAEKMESFIRSEIQAEIQAVVGELGEWSKYNSHDMGEMGKFIRLKYVVNKLAQIKKEYNLSTQGGTE